MEFKQWFLINESKKQKELALELAGDTNILNQLNNEIPQGKKNTDSILLLAAYFYSKTKNINQIKIDIKDYIGHLDKNKMQLYDVDLKTKQPSIDYIAWTELIHAYKAEETINQTKKHKPTEQDFQKEIPIKSSPDGQIKVYRANSAQQCIILGKGQSFCISQPGNPMFQSYRDNQVSTFYFVYDNTRNDDLRIVVVDVNENGIELTDCKNQTNMSIQDPYSNEEKRIKADSELYFQYLTEKGINTNIFVNIEKTPEEEAEQEKLGTNNRNFDWFKSLSFDEKSKYIGRGHSLTNGQFDYLFDNKLILLLEQYVKTGLQLTDHQIDKVASDKDLKSNYIHNRMIALQHLLNINNKEWDLLSDKQKKEIYEYPNVTVIKVLALGNLEFLKHLIDVKKQDIPSHAIDYAVIYALKSGNFVKILKYLVDEKNQDITISAKYRLVDIMKSGNIELVQYVFDRDINHAIRSGNLQLVKYLIDEKKQEIPNNAVDNALKLGNLEIVKYLVDIKKKPFTYDSVDNALRSGSLELVKYFSQKHNPDFFDEMEHEIPNNAVNNALQSGNFEIVQYLVDEKELKIPDDAVDDAARSGSLELVKYLIDEKDYPIPNGTVTSAARSGSLKLVQYLIEVKGEDIPGNAVKLALYSGSLELVQYLVDVKKQKIPNDYKDALDKAAYSGSLELVQYLVDVKNQKFDDYTLEKAVKSGSLELIKYLTHKHNRI